MKQHISLPFPQYEYSNCVLYCISNLFHDDMVFDKHQLKDGHNEQQEITVLNKYKRKYLPQIKTSLTFINNWNIINVKDIQITPTQLMKCFNYKEGDEDQYGFEVYSLTVSSQRLQHRLHCIYVLKDMKKHTFYLLDPVKLFLFKLDYLKELIDEYGNIYEILNLVVKNDKFNPSAYHLHLYSESFEHLNLD